MRGIFYWKGKTFKHGKERPSSTERKDPQKWKGKTLKHGKERPSNIERPSSMEKKDPQAWKGKTLKIEKKEIQARKKRP